MYAGTFSSEPIESSNAQDRLVRASVQRAVQRRGRAGERRVHVGLRRADGAHRVRAGVQLVIRVQDEQHVEPFPEHVERLVAETRVDGVAAGVDEPACVRVSFRGSRRHARVPRDRLRAELERLGEHEREEALAHLRVLDLFRLRMERAERRIPCDENRHRGDPAGNDPTSAAMRSRSTGAS
jgi:hypothetical protein